MSEAIRGRTRARSSKTLVAGDESRRAGPGGRVGGGGLMAGDRAGSSDSVLYGLIALAVVLSLGHHIDHADPWEQRRLARRSQGQRLHLQPGDLPADPHRSDLASGRQGGTGILGVPVGRRCALPRGYPLRAPRDRTAERDRRPVRRRRLRLARLRVAGGVRGRAGIHVRVRARAAAPASSGQDGAPRSTLPGGAPR